MAQLKAGEIDRYLQKADTSSFLWLVYGPDRGLVAERSSRIAKLSGVALDDPFSSIRLDASSGEGQRLSAEANTVGMFASDRLVWVTSAGNDKTLVDQVKDLIAKPPAAVKIILEAGDLKKGASLRATVEGSKGGMALPCYSDSAQTVSRLIEEVFSASGQRLEADARNVLQSHLGGDRGATRSELEKLALYTLGSDTISLTDVEATVGDAVSESVDAIIDAVVTGNIEGFDDHFARFLHGKGDFNTLYFAALRQFQQLDTLRADMDTSGRNAAAVVASAKPPIFYSRKAAVETALRKWTAAGLRSALKRLGDGLLTLRQNPSLATETTRLTLLGLAVQSARRR